MERDGLVTVDQDRHLELTGTGEQQAVRVMRKHRLAECMLVEILAMPWEDVHAEACRWEHVMSDAVERRILELLDHPSVSPYGNPIPGLAELDPGASKVVAGLQGLLPLPEAVTEDLKRVRVRRLAETLQTDEGSSFRRMLKAQRRYADRHIILRGCVKKTIGPQGMSEQVLTSSKALLDCLHDDFDLNVPEVAAEWSRIENRHQELFG